MNKMKTLIMGIFSQLSLDFLSSIIVLQLVLTGSNVETYKIAPPDSSFPGGSSSASNTKGLILPNITLHNGSIDGVNYYAPDQPKSSLIFQNATMFIIPTSRYNIVFKCAAKYPIFWNLAHAKIHSTVVNSIRISSTRQFVDAFDPATFSYESLLSLNGPATQLSTIYKCQSTARHEIESSIHVYWQSSYGSIFIHSKENVTVEINPTDTVIELPCHVSDPEVTPRLTKDVGTLSHPNFTEIHLNDSVLYAPLVGFTLKNLRTPAGTYKCDLGSDYVSVNVVQKNVSAMNQPYIFQYNEDLQQVKCCSMKKKPPKIALMLCEHASTCGIREHYETSDRGFMFNQGKRRANCSVLTLKTYHTGIIRCIGDGFNMYREFIAAIRSDYIPWNAKRNTTTYFRWEEIDPQEMLAVRNTADGIHYYHIDPYGVQTRKPIDKTVYSNQTVSLECHTSRYYFGSGTHWMIRWQNGSLTPAGAAPERGISLRGHYYPYDMNGKHVNTISITASTDMESILCFAPVWNSSVWVPKIHYLYVNETVPPQITEPVEVVELTWFANETAKVLNCSGTGLPAPDFIWEKDNATITLTSHNYIVVNSNATAENVTTETTTIAPAVTINVNNTNTTLVPTEDVPKPMKVVQRVESTLKILRVSHGTKGVFRCVASNFGGKMYKEFHITVLEKKSWTSTVVIVVASISTVALTGAILFLLRKVYLDRKEIKQLTSVNFKDVSRRSSLKPEEEETTNSVPFDTGRMTNSLIDIS